MRYKDTALVVLSCDGYSDLWEPFFKALFLNWKDCPFNIYLVSNTKKYKDDRVTTLLSGDDNDWSSTLRKCINEIKEDNLLFFLEDVFIKTKVDNRIVDLAYSFFINNNLEYLRLRPSPRPDVKYNKQFGNILPSSMYRTSLFASFWKKNVFLDILKDGESAWEFELKGSSRSSLYKNFYSTYFHLFDIIHGVEKGKWMNSSLSDVINLGLIQNTKLNRPLYYNNRFEEFIKRDFLLNMKMRLLDLIPTKYRASSIYFLGNIKRKIFK